ncbi:hybrid sensor histidine kinase/response regulator [Tabrizicola sp. WMC-M-20]|nr:hybrid sensor histidine kinase/response regulator [Tabrizicola sp. WMC-M-20]
MKYIEGFRWFAIATSILLFVAVMAFSHSVGVSQAALDRVTQYDWSTSALQGRSEAAEMERHVTQLALSDDQPSLDAAFLRHQILLSRLRSWDNSDFGQFLDEDPRLMDQYGTLVTDMESVGIMLLELRDKRTTTAAIDRADAITRTIERAGEIKRAVDRVGMRALAHGLTEMIQARDDLRTKQTAQKVINGSLFTTAAILLLVTIWQNRSLVQSNAAIAGGARQLAEREAELSTVLASTTDSVLTMDTDWRVTYANQNAIDFLFSSREFIGISFWDLLPDLVGSKFECLYRRVMERQVSEESELFYTRLGSWFEVYAHPSPEKLTIFFRDVSAQRRVEERFRHVAQASSDFIFDRDIGSDMTWVSDAASWLPGYPPGPHEVPRNAWVDSVHPEDNEEILAQIEAAIGSGQDLWEGEYRLRTRDGTYIPVRERASILRNDNGEPVRMIGNIINLSEQKALEAQLRQSQRLDAVGQLTGGIAHDFNNLLTVILGSAETLTDTLPADHPGATTARQIIIASERAAELTQRLLAFARKQPLSPGVFDANEIVEGMRMLVERSITPAITLELDLARNLGAVHIDRAMFESALLNLCVNARDAMPNGGTLRIETSTTSLPWSAVPDVPEPDQYVRVVVSDTGEGMDDDTLARAFEPYFTTKPVGAGSGLGLSMVHGFVHQSGGHIRMQSALGTGTTVELLLPRHARPVNDHIEPEAELATRKSVPRGRILVVDDEDQVREYLSMVVQSLGYEVESEPLATTALIRLRAGEPFDLLLSDIVMPGMVSGRQLAEMMLEERPGLPVLLVSGHSEEFTAADGQLDPRIGFLRKPFRKRELAQRLEEMLPAVFG